MNWKRYAYTFAIGGASFVLYQLTGVQLPDELVSALAMALATGGAAHLASGAKERRDAPVTSAREMINEAERSKHRFRRGGDE